MTQYWHIILLGIIQGITEWLPVSSKGINTLVQLHFFQMPLAEALRLSIWLHTGTLLSAVIYFRRDIITLMRDLPGCLKIGNSKANSRELITYLIITTIVSGALGAPMLLLGISRIAVSEGYVMGIIGIFLLISGILQKVAARSSGVRTAAGKKDALLLGTVQALSVFPGLSRSGLTVSTLLLRKFEPGHAMRLSFLMSIPLVFGAEIVLNLSGDVSPDMVSLAGIVPAFLVGMLTISGLLNLAKRIKFWKFCIFLGALSMIPLVIELL